MTTTTKVEKLVEPYVDLGNLLLIDRDPIETLSNIDEARLAAITRDNVQCLFNKIWTLPRKVIQDATCAELPECEYALPREKPLPKPKEPTKWEKFAKEKGIVKQKRSKKLWDESAQDWKPRYGYKSANNEKQKDWLIEIPEQADPYKDFFAEKADAKRERVHKQELHRLKNVARTEKGDQSQQMPSLASQSSAFKQHIQQETGNKRAGGRRNLNVRAEPLGLGQAELQSRDELTHQLSRAKTATASMGKFQPSFKGEKTPRTGLKRKFEPNEGNVEEERKHQLEILAKLQSNSGKKSKLSENRFNAVNEHMIREEKRSAEERGESKVGRGDGKAGGKSSGRRSKSQIDRQQHFQQRMKRTKSSGFKSARSKAGKATGVKGRKK